MFYIRYLFAEVFRRWGKTLTITMGLAIASAIIILIISISQALSKAQETVLNPLENVGTDIMLTRSVGTDKMQELDQSTRQELLSENRIGIDLSKLGNPGDVFSADSFMAGTMLTFDADTTDKLDKNQIADYTGGLVLSVSHQEGTIPKVTSTFRTGGERIQISQDIAAMTDEERSAIDAARSKAMTEIQALSLDPRSEEARAINRKYQDAAMPERFKKMTTEVVTPEKSITQDVGPIQTDIKTSNFTIAGVDTTKTNMGLILPDQVVAGSYFNGENQIIVNKAYADKESKKVGDEIKFNSTEYTIVGVVSPKLYTNTADFYLPLTDLQKISGKENKINVLLIKSTNADAVDATSASLESLFAGTKVVNAKDTAKQVSGSLVSAANLTNRFIGLTSIIVVIAAFIIVSLLTVSSINKRTREIGTLKAIGWSNSEVIRQIVAENILLGIIGALAGLALGVVTLFILNRYDISLSANIESMNATATNMFKGFVRGGDVNTTATTSDVMTTIHLKASFNYLVFVLGSAIAIGGAVISGLFAALKASTLKPQVALRNLE